ncbi:MAG: type IX secretion system membrane protein PorP/SprF [Bacteroidota bacterium]
MIRYRLIILAILSLAGKTLAQQRPVQSLYMFDPILINPAYAGTQVQLSATAIYRNQWVNLEGAPKTVTASVHSGFYKAKMGLGVIFANDQIGIHNDASFYGIYSYKIRLTEASTLSFGLQGGFNNLRSDYNKLTLKNQGDPNLSGVLTKFNPNVGTGIFYRKKNFYFGASVPQLIKNKVFNIEEPTSGPSLSRQERYYYILTGTTVKLANQVKLFPSTLIRFQDQAPLSFDLNTTFVLYDAVGLGVSYRLNEGIVGLFELQINQNFHVGYAYDFTASELRQFSNGSHEIMINYRIKIQKFHAGMPCPTYW